MEIIMLDDYSRIIAANIKRLREEKKWSQKDLATKMNIARPTVSKWENQQSEPTSTQLANLAKIFNVSTEIILGNKDKETHKVIVVDTSIFIKRPQSINEFIDIFDEVIIPDIVMAELNHLKDNKHSKVNKMAWLAMVSINKYMSDSKLVIAKTDVKNKEINDKKIAGVAIDRAKTSLRDKVYMYSDDIYFSFIIEDEPNLEVIGPDKFDEFFGVKDSEFDFSKTQNFFSLVKNKRMDKIKELNFKDIDVNHCDPTSGYTPAIRNRSYSIVNYLINEIPLIDLDKRDKQKYNFTPLLHVCQIKDIKMMHMLLDSGADPNVSSTGKNFGNTPLMVSAWGGFFEGVKLLSEQDICYNQQDLNGFTALHKACIKNHSAIAQILIDSTDIKIRDHKNKTADKHLIASNPTSKKIMQMFIKKRGNII
jgi:transcriptional regulator with XRE-family HTH domain